MSNMELTAEKSMRRCVDVPSYGESLKESKDIIDTSIGCALSLDKQHGTDSREVDETLCRCAE